MKNHKLHLLALGLGVLLGAQKTRADNPLILDQFTADPTARLFEGKIFLYPSHDMPAGRGTRGGIAGFAMEDYHAFSSENLIDWKDHGVIITQKDVPWVNGSPNSMWAPDCVTKDGKYYFYFPAANRIGVAIADKPEGPFKVEPQSITNGIDPCCFIDPKDGKAYLVWKGGALSIAKLKDDMKSLDGPSQNFPRYAPPSTASAPNRASVPTTASAPSTATAPGGRRGGGFGAFGGAGQGGDNGLVEGPFMFERKGKYYLTYPHAVRTAGYEAEQLEYCIGDNPMGPFKYGGIIMDESASHCWTNHHSLVEYKGQWILFYHDKDLSPNNDKNRSVGADYLTFNDDGTMNKVIPTLRGVGIMDAKGKVQIDRYSEVSKGGTTVAFLDDAKKGEGWKIKLSDKDAWVRYDRVEFGAGGLKAVNVRAASAEGGAVEIHIDKPDGPLVAKVAIPKGADWGVVNAKLTSSPSSMHNLVVTMPEKADAEIDWVSFE